MTELIKQRLVGMLIVVIAGVVFLPDLLDGKKQLTKEEFKKIPPKPEVNEQPILTEFPREQVMESMAEAPQNNDVIASDAVTVSATDKVEINVLPQEDEVSNPQVETASNDNSESAPEQSDVGETTSDFKQPAWILQLGSFKHKENVDALRQKLQEAGFNTFTKPVQTKAGVLSKVYLGPAVEKSELQEAQLKLKELVGLEGKITRFDPIK